jgi:hypothetical protein
MPWSDPLAQLTRASVAALRSDTRGAVRLLASAETGFEAADEGLYAAAARARRGELLGRPEGERLRAEAGTWMSKERIANPTRIRMLLSPGEMERLLKPGRAPIAASAFARRSPEMFRV